jgi:glycerophosphoryl diester phosphodiesterase
VSLLQGTDSRILIAHRGASGSAPEHTIAAYGLAIEQGADFIEPDLQITRDGVLICLHDLTLERTTDVRDVFPDRFRTEAGSEGPVSRWYASDFTLTEIRRLDAGSWFGPRFRDSRIPTLSEAIELAMGNAGIFPETKAPKVYGAMGFSMERLLVEELRRHALDRRDANPATPVVIQSFSWESLEAVASDLGSDLETVFLVDAPDGSGWLSREGLARAARIADGIGPAKGLLLERPGTVQRAHELGLRVFPWTFRAAAPGTFGSVAAEMSYYLYELGVDGLFTNDPDQFPRYPPAW